MRRRTCAWQRRAKGKSVNDSIRIEQQLSPSTQAARERVAAHAKLQDAFVRAMSSEPPPATIERPALDHELTSLVERFCSQMYVGETSHASQSRLLLTLQGALPGASAEIVREGAFLRVRLRAASDEIFRRMESRRQTLVDALTQHGSYGVTVEVIRDPGASRGGPA
jgi:hypothetical protein